MFTVAGMELEYPLSLGVYQHYVAAQQAVDYLADHGFPVQNLEIIGTELRSVERVTGRPTRGKIAAAGTLSGLWMGLFVGVAFSLFSNQNQFGFLVTVPLLGAVFGLVWSRVISATAPPPCMAPVTSPPSSRSSPPSTKYSWNTHATRARELLTAMPA